MSQSPKSETTTKEEKHPQDLKNESTSNSTKSPIKRRNVAFLFVIGNLSILGAFFIPPEWRLSSPIRNYLLLCFSLIWLGMILAISFMESWVKFKAQSLQKHIGIDVGRTVFWALNRVEILLAGTLFFLAFTGPSLPKYNLYSLLLSIGILIFQVVMLQPYLDNRAIIYNQTGTPPSDKGRTIHSLYIVLEVLKLIALLTFAVTHSNSPFSIKTLSTLFQSLFSKSKFRL